MWVSCQFCGSVDKWGELVAVVLVSVSSGWVVVVQMGVSSELVIVVMGVLSGLVVVQVGVSSGLVVV